MVQDAVVENVVSWIAEVGAARIEPADTQPRGSVALRVEGAQAGQVRSAMHDINKNELAS